MRPNRHTPIATRCRMPAAMNLAVLAVLGLSACSSDGDDDDGRHTGPVHYELATGTRRDYRVTIRTRVITLGGPEMEWARSEHLSRMTIIGPVVHHGQEYALERVANGVRPLGEPESIYERHLREDDTGLFGSHWAPSDPGLPDERQYLEYPLAIGAQWFLVEDVPIILRALRREVVTVPAGEFDAWRIDAVPSLNTGFGNTYSEWYGTAGMIKSFGHQEVELGTEPRSRRITEETWELAEYDEDSPAAQGQAWSR